MMKVRCGSCGEEKDEPKFWSVYTGSDKRQDLHELSPKTIGVMKRRHNKQRNCKECAHNWSKYNNHRVFSCL